MVYNEQPDRATPRVGAGPVTTVDDQRGHRPAHAATAGIGAPRPLADELFLVFLDDRSGGFRAKPRTVELALAGALLGELLLDRRIAITQGRVRVIASGPPPPDRLTRILLGQLLAEVDLEDVRPWIAYLSQTAVRQVAVRLRTAGLVDHTHSWRSGDLYPARDQNRRFLGTVRLRHTFSATGFTDWQSVLLAGLLDASSALNLVLWTPGELAAGHQLLAKVFNDADAIPCQELVAHVQAAVGAAVLANT